MKDFILLSCSSPTDPEYGHYRIRFGNVYGKDGFIVGSSAGCEIDVNGNVHYCAISPDTLSDFDPASVASLTKEQVLQEARRIYYTENNPNSTLPPECLSIRQVKLFRQNGEFKLYVYLLVEPKDGPSSLDAVTIPVN